MGTPLQRTPLAPKFNNFWPLYCYSEVAFIHAAGVGRLITPPLTIMASCDKVRILWRMNGITDNRCIELQFSGLRHLGFIATTIIMVNSTHGMLTDFNNDECA